MQIVVLILITFAASFVGTMSGFGTSTVMVPVLLVFLPLPLVLLFVGIIHLCGDIWKMLLFRRGLNIKLLTAFGLPGIVAAFFGARIPLHADPALLKQVMGGFLITYAAFLLIRPRWKVPAGTCGALLGGTLSGIFAGAFGVGGAVRGAFLTAYDLPKAVYIFTSGAIALCIDSSRIGSYLLGGTRLPRELLTALVVCIPLSFAGAWLAKKILHTVPERSFRSLIMLLLGLVALKLLIWP